MNKEEDTNQQGQEVAKEEAGSIAVKLLRQKMEKARKGSHVNNFEQSDGMWRGFD